VVVATRSFSADRRNRSSAVNRLTKLTPDRRPKLTPLDVALTAALAPAELVGVAQPGRARVGEEAFAEDQARFLKRQLSLPVSTMSQ
jgi:hypothetical protein